MSLVERIDLEIEKRSLLNHPFYQMWTKGELTLDNLAGYSKEYFQLVLAVPELVQMIKDKSNGALIHNAVSENLAEEREHVDLWARFASSLGISREELEDGDYSPKTIEAVSEMKKLAGSSFLEAVASMYAYEAELPKISRSKLDGLKSRYALDSKDATVYFETHEEADVRHAALWRAILSSKVSPEMQEKAFGAAVESLKAQNKLLDGIMEKYAA